MIATVLSVLALVAMVGCLLVIPLGLPGVWGMVAIAGIGAAMGAMAPSTLLWLAVAAGVAEVVEFLAVKRMGARFGASGKAFWGALAGGLAGAVIGVPVPVIGSVIGVFIGTFAGAVVVTLLEGRSMVQAGSAGWGTVVGRGLAVAVKGAAGVLILTVTTLAFFF